MLNQQAQWEMGLHPHMITLILLSCNQAPCEFKADSRQFGSLQMNCQTVGCQSLILLIEQSSEKKKIKKQALLLT
jgi:hypothetical protein